MLICAKSLFGVDRAESAVAQNDETELGGEL